MLQKLIVVVYCKQEVERYLENYNRASIQDDTSNAQSSNESVDSDVNHLDSFTITFNQFQNKLTDHFKIPVRQSQDLKKEIVRLEKELEKSKIVRDDLLLKNCNYEADLKKVSEESDAKEKTIHCLLNELKLVTAERDSCESKLETFQRQKNDWGEKLNEFLKMGNTLEKSFSGQ